MLVSVSYSFDIAVLNLHPNDCKLLISALRKELSYWQYKLSFVTKNSNKFDTAKLNYRIKHLRLKVSYYTELIVLLESNMYKCEYQESKCN
jgi:hypothetical protein